MKSRDCILFSGGVNGAEAAFGDQAEAAGVEEVNFTFDGHKTKRKRGVRFLTSEELLSGDVSLAYVSKLMNRTYSSGPLFRKVLQSIWHQINHAEEVFAVGKILDDAKGPAGERNSLKSATSPCTCSTRKRTVGLNGKLIAGRRKIPSRSGKNILPERAPVF